MMIDMVNDKQSLDRLIVVFVLIFTNLDFLVAIPGKSTRKGTEVVEAPCLSRVSALFITQVGTILSHISALIITRVNTILSHISALIVT